MQMFQSAVAQENTRRINEIDIAKGIGILCVVIGHRLAAMEFSNSIISSFHMPLFFMLSGLVMRSDMEFSWVKSIRAEKKMLSSYVFWSAVFIVFDVIVRFLILKEYTMTDLVLDCYMTVLLFGISVLWFLATLIIGKILSKWVISKTTSAVIQFVIGTVSFIVIAAITQIYVEMLGEIHGVTKLIYYLTMMVLRSVAMTGFVLCGYALKNLVGRMLKSRWGGVTYWLCL